jgi:nucleoside-diphosphate-sugar epimerase
MNSELSVLVTGATGLVGSDLMSRLLARDSVDLHGCSRRGSAHTPHVIPWEMAHERPPPRLQRHWDVVVNAAASTRWTMGLEEAAAANVATVQALRPLVSLDTHVIHVSTAYALGLRGGAESSAPGDFRNSYEWSKARAEQVARRSFTRLTIIRPPLIIGSRRDGRATRFVGMYTLLRGIATGTVPAMVADPAAYFDAVPVDDLSRLLVSRALDPDHAGNQVLTIAAGSGAPAVGTAVDTVVGALNRWRRARGIQPVATPPLVAPDTWNRFFLPLAEKHLSLRQKRILSLLRSFEPYLAIESPIEADHTVEDVLACLAPSVAFWADLHPRIASVIPRQWCKDEAA